MLKPFAVLIVLPGLAGCAGVAESRHGATGPALGAHKTIALGQMPPGPEGEPAQLSPADAATAALARDAVAAALGQRGIAIDPQSSTRIDMSFAMRPAATGISVPGAADLSPRRHRWALQTCRHTVFRLRLAYVAPIPGMTTGSGYAEESRCHADAARLIPGLARRAVAALLDQNRPR